jgi:hypothetical protein
MENLYLYGDDSFYSEHFQHILSNKHVINNKFMNGDDIMILLYGMDYCCKEEDINKHWEYIFEFTFLRNSLVFNISNILPNLIKHLELFTNEWHIYLSRCYELGLFEELINTIPQWVSAAKEFYKKALGEDHWFKKIEDEKIELSEIEDTVEYIASLEGVYKKWNIKKLCLFN